MPALTRREKLDQLHEEFRWSKAKTGLCGHCIEDRDVLPNLLPDDRTVLMCRPCTGERYWMDLLIPMPRMTTEFSYTRIRSIPYEGELRSIDFELSITDGL